MNSQLIKLNEGTAARRKIPFYLAMITDGHSPSTGTVFGAAEIKVSKNGGAEANFSGTVTELAGGVYVYEAAASEVDTLGFLSIRAETATARGRTFVQIVAHDVYDSMALGLANLDAAVSTRATPAQILATPANLLTTDGVGRVTVGTNDDKTGYALSTGGEDAVADKVWDESRAGHVGAGSFGEGVASVQGDVTGSVGSLGVTAKADVNAEVDSALNTAIPGSPTADSVNERIKALDDAYTAAKAAFLDVAISSRAAPGAAMTLTTSERDQVASALLNLADGIETSFTVKQTLRLMAAVLCGKVSAGPSTPIFRNLGDTANRVQAIADGNGNRTSVNLFP
jgi:hypothetical protein